MSIARTLLKKKRSKTFQIAYQRIENLHHLQVEMHIKLCFMAGGPLRRQIPLGQNKSINNHKG